MIATRRSSRIHLTLLMFCIFSRTNARSLLKSTQLPFLGRMDLPPICRPRSLEPALGCGCFLYFPYYRYDPYWDFLEDLCLEELSGNIQSGERRCSSSPYGNGYQSSSQGRSRNRIEHRAAQFFRDARRQCSYIEEGYSEETEYSSTTTSSTSDGGSSTTTSYSSSTSSGTSTTTVVTINGSGSGPRRNGNRSSSRSVNTGDSGGSRLQLDANEPKSEASLQSVMVLRRIATRVQKKLKDFCLVVVRFKSKTKQELVRFENKCHGRR